MVYSRPPLTSGSGAGATDASTLTYDDSQATSPILSGSATESVQDIIEALAAKPGTLTEVISLTIPANTWTIIPLSGTIANAHNFKLFVGDDDLTESINARRAGSSFELISLTALTVDVHIEGV